MSTSTTTNDDPKRGWLSGLAAYPDTVFESKRFGETRTEPGSGDPKYAITAIFVGPTLIQRNTGIIGGAIKSIIDDFYPGGKRMPPRGLRGVKQQPLLKKVTDYPKMWAGCPDDNAVFVRVSSQSAPTLFDADGSIMTPEAAKHVIKWGALVHVLFNAYHYEAGGDPGISLGLLAVKYVRPGPYKIGGFGASPSDGAGPEGVDPDELFGDLESGV